LLSVLGVTPADAVGLDVFLGAFREGDCLSRVERGLRLRGTARLDRIDAMPAKLAIFAGELAGLLKANYDE
jgi:hypothetical protein